MRFYRRFLGILRAVHARYSRDVLAKSAFVLSLVVLALGYGTIAGFEGLFPLPMMRAAWLTSIGILEDLTGAQLDANKGYLGLSNVPLARLAQSRIVADEPNTGRYDEHLLLTGGPGQFLDICPVNGCLAVEITRANKVEHAWPFRPEDFEKKALVADEYEGFTKNPSMKVYGAGLAQLSNGDLVAIFLQWNSFPDGGGIARVDRNGRFVWFRRDYAHHWPTVLSGDRIVYPSTDLREGRTTIPLGGRVSFTLGCPWKYYADTIVTVSAEGAVLDKISVLDSLLASPFRFALARTWSPCDALHVNSVYPVGQELAAALQGVAPDDLVVSMRSINAFGIIGRASHQFKRLYFGTFAGQHSVQPIGGSKVILYDNLGGDQTGGPSRLLVDDLASGSTRPVPVQLNGHRLHFFSDFSANISLSLDRTRAIFTVTKEGRAYEIRLSDGAVLTTFENLHNVQSLMEAHPSMFAGRFEEYGVYYVRRAR